MVYQIKLVLERINNVKKAEKFLKSLDAKIANKENKDKQIKDNTDFICKTRLKLIKLFPGGTKILDYYLDNHGWYKFDQNRFQEERINISDNEIAYKVLMDDFIKAVETVTALYL